jgi:hypothetical protein
MYVDNFLVFGNDTAFEESIAGLRSYYVTMSEAVKEIQIINYLLESR